MKASTSKLYPGPVSTLRRNRREVKGVVNN
jgi:hypothetical protein